MDALLTCLVQFDGGERIIGFSGPTASARLACSARLLAESLPWSALHAVLAALPAVATRAAELPQTALLKPEGLTAAAGSEVAQGLFPEPRVMHILCRLCAGTAVADSLDELCRLLAHGLDPGPAARWARVLRLPGVGSLLERASPAPAPTETSESPAPTDALTEASKSPAADAELFAAIFKSSLSEAVRAISEGASLESAGDRMLNGDPGCCRWSPIAAAGFISARRGHGEQMVALLLAARADADAVCEGPCGWTPLMWTARAGRAAAAACRLLVLAGADVRRKSGGQTALEMGDKENARSIRDARDERAAMPGKSIADADAKARECDKGKGTSIKRANKAMAPHRAAALAAALAAVTTGKGKGRAKGGYKT
eukprot:TRINITY_DN105112_c0_g1_i1.p1 TRINITY_DN105112_c0_g1~~TRINITY_DN105112_c0_g1_i1.p1  ORF type:complete len:373 (-),score=73.61 TRINITY_DN105112_c0_g1_i1:34-1152(-)